MSRRAANLFTSHARSSVRLICFTVHSGRSTFQLSKFASSVGIGERLPTAQFQARHIHCSHTSLSNDQGSDGNETHGQPMHRFGSSHSLSTAADRYDSDRSYDHSAEAMSHKDEDRAADQHVDVYNHDPSVNLSACMQSQVPEPYGKMPTFMNMPGGVSRREDKYIQGQRSDLSNVSGSREYSTDSKSKAQLRIPHTDEHGNPTYMSIDEIMQTPCPQGVQGENCAEFKLWLSNCLHHGSNTQCEQLANEYIAGKKTLAQVFSEYEFTIKQSAESLAASNIADAAKVGADNTPSNAADATSVAASSPKPATDSDVPKKLTRRERLRTAVKVYGTTVIVFHVTISLASLGFFYALVASNVDVVKLLSYFHVGFLANVSALETASTFAVAYGIHKVFAPVRIGITLTCAPLIVRSLRARGILKTPPPTK